MSSFALFLCILFVVVLIRLERKQSPMVSTASWIPTIWLLYCGSKALGEWFHISSTVEAGSPADRVFLIILFCFGLTILLKRNFDWSIVTKENAWLFAIIVFMLISILWSNMPATSFKRWFRELIAIIMVFVVASESSPRLAMQSILRRAIYILIPFSIVLIKYFPYLGRAYNRWTGEVMWIGVSTHKNGLARICMISVIFLVWIILTKHKKQYAPITKYLKYADILLLLLSLYLLGGPQTTLKHSATASASLMVGLFFIAFFLWAKRYGKKPSPITLTALLVVLIIYGTATPFLGKLSILDVSSYFGRSENLTGRSVVWAMLIPYAIRKPILGHGVGGFWTSAMRETTEVHAHNGYLDLILNFGFIGLIIFTLFYLACCKRAIRTLADDYNWGFLFISFIFMTITYNIAEVSIYTFTSPLSTVILLFYVSSKSGDIIKSHMESN